MTTKSLILIWVLWLCLELRLAAVTPSHNGVSRLHYTRGTLLDLRFTVYGEIKPDVSIPSCILRNTQAPGCGQRKKKKRGSRGGIRNRLRRRGSRLPLPALTLSNVRSLHNKMIELTAIIQNDGDYRRTSLFCFTETWLTEEVDINLNGFTIIRADRDSMKTQKKVGGGLCMAENNRWATNFTIRETVSTKDLELITVSFRPHYLP